MEDSRTREQLLQENSLLRDRVRDLEARLIEMPHVCRTTAAEPPGSGSPASLCRNPQLSEILNTVPVSIVIVDAASRRLQLANRRARELAGLGEEDVPPPGRIEACAVSHPNGITLEAYYDRLCPERADGSPLSLPELPIYKALVQGETIRNQELQLHLADGRRIPILGSAAPLRDEQGRIISAIGVFDDFSEYKHIEQSLHENEERQAFLLRLAGVLRPLGDPLEIQSRAAQLLGEWLRVSRVFYIAIEDSNENFRIDRGYSTPEAPIVYGRQRMAGFLPTHMEALRNGRTLAVADVLADNRMAEAEINTYASIGIRAHVTVPLLKEGRLTGMLAVHNVAPRAWSDAEVTLIEQVAGLTWTAVELAAAESALRDSEKRMRIILENLSDGITLFDIASDRYIYMSPKATEHWGLTPDEINAMPIPERQAHIHPDDLDAFERQRSRAIIGQAKPEGVEYRWRKRDGTYRWFSDRHQLVCDDNGRPLALVSISRDITQGKESERILETALRNTEARTQELKTVIDSLPDGLTIYDREITPVFLNEPARRFFTLFGLQVALPAAERIAQAHVHFRDGRKVTIGEWPTYITFMTGDVIKDFIVMNGPASDTTSYYSISTAPIRDADGTVTGVVALVKDITGRIQAEERIRESETRALALVDRLREADQQKNRFISMLSHELRNPLAAIMLSISLMEHASAEDRHFQRGWDVIKRQSAQLARLVDDLLDVTRITENRIALKKEPVDLVLVVQRAVADYAHPLEANGVALETDLPGEPVCLEADPVRITQVIGNLLNNAVKFTAKGDTVRVSLRTEPHAAGDAASAAGDAASAAGDAASAAGDAASAAGSVAGGGRNGGGRSKDAVIRIADTGMGIRPEIMANIFQPFVQADTSLDRRDSGLGLGLAIVKGMVDLHGGSVEGTSAGPGKGSAFTIRLPLPED